MREIKFRAWCIADKFMCYESKYWSMSALYSCKYHIMQYTGLKDKNGKEIYEGDVVDVIVWNYDCKEEEEREIIVVSYEFGGFTPWIGQEGQNSHEDIIGIKEVEILGNIHEATPEQMRQWNIDESALKGWGIEK